MNVAAKGIDPNEFGPALFRARFETPLGTESRPGEQGDPISVYLTLRKFGPISDTKELPGILMKLASIGQELVETRVVPGLLVPIREAIGSGNA